MSEDLLFCLKENCSVCGRLDPPDWSKTNNLGRDLADFWSKLFSIKIIILHPSSFICYWSMSVMVSKYSSSKENEMSKNFENESYINSFNL